MKRLFIVVFVFILAFGSLKAGAVSAEAFAVINGDTGEIIYSKNAHARLSMASTTKIMTALVAIESGNLEKEVLITSEMTNVEGTSLGLRAGEKISLESLICGMMLCSGNDAANAIAISVGKTFENFALMMNKRAKSLSLQNTNFVTPSGLDADGHFTSAYDLAIITKEAFKYDVFRKTVSLKSAAISIISPQRKITVTNHNKLLWFYDDVVGVKTGFTKKAGRCLVSASEKDGKFIIAVTLNDGNDWADHRELLDIGLSSVEKKCFNEISGEIGVFGSKNKITVKAEKVSIFAKSDSAVKQKIYMPLFLFAPVKKGEIVGIRCFYCENKEILKQEIKATNTNYLKTATKTQKFIRNLFCLFRSINEG